MAAGGAPARADAPKDFAMEGSCEEAVASLFRQPHDRGALSAELRGVVVEALERGHARLLDELRGLVRRDFPFSGPSATVGSLASPSSGRGAESECSGTEVCHEESHEWTFRHMGTYALGRDVFGERPERAPMEACSAGLRRPPSPLSPVGTAGKLRPAWVASSSQRGAGPGGAEFCGVLEVPGVPSSGECCCADLSQQVTCSDDDTGRIVTEVSHAPTQITGKAYLTEAFRQRFRQQVNSGSGTDLGPGRKRCLLGGLVARAVRSQRFDTFICTAVLLNAFLMGLQVDYVATHKSDRLPPALQAAEAAFCFVFMVELCMRIYVWKWQFFMMSGREWNFLDIAVVAVQLFEVLTEAFVDSEAMPKNSFSVVRILRILRLIRVIRLVRILRAISDLRMLVISILTSMKSLFWTVILLFLLVYTISLYFTQLVADHRKGLDSDSPEYRELGHWYGSLGSTMLSMFEAITGGVDWETIARPLMDQISPWFALLFSVYIAFCLLALLNVVTGVFVESVLKSAKSDKDMFMINNARELFQSLEGGLMAMMTWEDFKDHIDAPQMQEFLKAIDLDPSEAKGLFRLLDLDNSGSVSAEEFLNGCLRLRGAAKALVSQQGSLQEVTRMSHRLFKRPAHERAPTLLQTRRTLGSFCDRNPMD